MNVISLHCKRQDLRSDDHVKWRPLKNSVLNQYFRAKYIDTQTKSIFLVPSTCQECTQHCRESNQGSYWSIC